MERRPARLSFPKDVREDVRHEQGRRCADCGEYHSSLQTHHVLPSSMYGSIDRRNAVGLCPRCHQRHDREAICNGRLFYEVLMDEGRWYEVRELAHLAGIPQGSLTSPDRLRAQLRRPSAPLIVQNEKPQNVTFADEPKRGDHVFYPLEEALKPLLETMSD